MHLRVIEETGFFTADEMLYPSNYQYLVDLLSYVAVGARSVENQEHRLVSSGISVPVGMKNPTAGSTTVMLNSNLRRPGAPRASSSATGGRVRRQSARARRYALATSVSMGAPTPTTTTNTWNV